MPRPARNSKRPCEPARSWACRPSWLGVTTCWLVRFRPPGMPPRLRGTRPKLSASWKKFTKKRRATPFSSAPIWPPSPRSLSNPDTERAGPKKRTRLFSLRSAPSLRQEEEAELRRDAVGSHGKDVGSRREIFRAQVEDVLAGGRVNMEEVRGAGITGRAWRNERAGGHVEEPELRDGVRNEWPRSTRAARSGDPELDCDGLRLTES